jgi:hypothetical protein
MKDLFIFLATALFLIVTWSGCKEMRMDMCETACAQKGLECASVSDSLPTRFTCREKSIEEPGVRKL